ncbi:type II toxin-antitoxin system RelE family toxin [Candidatus Nitrospira bockiana]
MAGKSRSVSLSKEAHKVLLSPDIPVDSIKQAIREIHANPLVGTALKGKLKGLRRYRVGRYRIVYTFNNTEISIATIKHRKEVYR